jgi:hypothetical protein
VIISRTTFRLFCCRYSAAWLFDEHFCQTTLALPKNCRAFVGNSSLLTGQDVQLLYRACMHAITITLVRALPRHPISDTEPCFMTKRSGSNTRRRAISLPVRLTAEEDQEIRKKAAECGKTVSGFLRAAALGKKVNSLTDDRVLKEVMRLGALQKKLFINGKRVGDREYVEVLIAITEYHRALLSRLMAD